MTEQLESSDFFRRRRFVLTVLIFLLLSSTAGSVVQGEEKETMAMRLGGCGGVYFYAPAGQLWVEVQKQDLNIRDTKTHLRALLVSPDRQVIEQAWISDDDKPVRSGPGPVQRALLRTDIKRPGVYGLNITVTEDRYGQEIARLAASPQGIARCDFPADSSRAGKLWRLHLNAAQAVISIDGLTRWEGGEARENLSLWTADLSSWFDFHDNRWLLTPYSRNVYGEPGREGTVSLTVHNNGAESKRVRLSLEFDEGAALPARLSNAEVELKPNSSAQVPLTYKVPSQGVEWKCYVRASVLDKTGFSTWSSLVLHRGSAPAQSPVKAPIKLEPYQHENEQFGYLPEYPLDNQVYFDMDNQPFIISSDGVFHIRDNTWAKTRTAQRADTNKIIRIRPLGTKIAFDKNNDVYFLVRDGNTTFFCRSDDHAESITAWPVPGSGNFDIEQFSGHNVTSEPPPLARFHQTARDPKLIWRRINDLELILPAKKPDGSIIMGETIAVSKNCIGLSGHSGIPSTIVSRGDKVHITWGEATPPEKKAPGVPTYVATYDRSIKRLESPVLVGYGPPANDVHNSPCITMDQEGYLHVLIGTHGRTFKYVRSLLPNGTDGGWTKAEDVGPGLRQTYVGMVCQ